MASVVQNWPDFCLAESNSQDLSPSASGCGPARTLGASVGRQVATDAMRCGFRIAKDRVRDCGFDTNTSIAQLQYLTFGQGEDFTRDKKGRRRAEGNCGVRNAEGGRRRGEGLRNRVWPSGRARGDRVGT